MPACKGRNPLSTLQKISGQTVPEIFLFSPDGLSPPPFAPDNRQPHPHTGKGKSGSNTQRASKIPKRQGRCQIPQSKNQNVFSNPEKNISWSNTNP